ncbi:MAG: heme exporter protein CcmD [Methylococcales bacterium]
MNLAEFFAMGGYAFYVWTSYGIALVVLAFNIIQPLIQQKRTLRAIRQRQQRHRATGLSG